MSASERDDPAAVDELVAAIGPRLDSPAINRKDVILVTGPWLAGVTGVVAALRQRLEQHTFVEATELDPGDAPTAVVFVVSAAVGLTDSDCTLLDAAAENTDVVVGVVSKIDMHLTWREVLAANRDRLSAHARRYAEVPWVGVAAAPELGKPRVDDLIETLAQRLADPDIPRRNRLRAWESRLRKVAERFDRDAEGSGRQARVEALREERSDALRQRRQSRTERSITLRGQIQQARVQLAYFARNRCSSVRGELQEDVSGLSRRDMAGFEARTRARVEEVVSEVADGTAEQLADVAEVMGVPLDLPPLEPLPTVTITAPPLKSRRLEMRLMMLLGAGFGLGVALTLTRLMTGLTAGLPVAVTAAGIAACVVIGLVVTVWVVNTRALLHDRALLDRWAGEVTAELRSVTEQLVASQVLVAESLLNTACSARDEAENTRVNDQVSGIDSELREHAIAAARAAAVRDREMPTVQAALAAVRAELGEKPGISPGIAKDEASVAADPAWRFDATGNSF
ncbi:hypothetical protein [Mycobacterium sp. 1423905.2]|uniref:hypothetical protein n=1 Tax=Mycobacterium sp. 1423905.2 TaxID=1856859 RepID=UPI000A55E59D|nr:hypothetical protein [Mycobacterium sp. 1423905.2]